MIGAPLDSWPGAADDLADRLRGLVERGRPGEVDEDALADLIEHDGRHRLERGLECGLPRYIRAIPGLESRQVALDAAIDIALRSLHGPHASADAIEQAATDLIAAFPSIAEQIRLASTLSRQIGQTVLGGGPPADLHTRIGRRCGSVLDGIGERYSLVSLLGSGSNGAVYKARDHLLSDNGHEVHVAIKFLHRTSMLVPPHDSNTLGTSPAQSLRRAQSKLLDEARRTRRVDHRNALRVLDFGVSAVDGAFVVTELVQGESLQDRVAREGVRMPPRVAAKIIAEAARGVDAAHNAGVLHCDLKPSNILLDPLDRPMVADFGAGTVLSAMSLDDAAPLGNVAFAAPEQFRREGASLGRSTDVYALGGILTHLISGQYPNGSTLVSIRARHYDPQLQPGSLRHIDGVDRALDAVCRKALAPTPDERYATAGALADDLEAWLALRPVSAWDAPVLVRSGWFVRRHRLATVAALVVIIGGGLFAYNTIQSNRKLAQQRALAKAEAEKAAAAEASRAITRQTIKALYKQLAAMPPDKRPNTPADAIEFMKPLIKNVEPETPAETPKP